MTLSYQQSRVLETRSAVLTTFVVALLAYLCLWGVLRYVADAAELSPLLRQLLFKGSLAALAMAGWLLTGRSYVQMGIARARPGSARLRWYAIAALSMGIGSMLGVALHIEHPAAAGMSPLQMIAVLWLFGSAAEELFTRGFAQSMMIAAAGERWKSLVIVLSAALFSAMHLPILISGVGIAGSLIVLGSTFLLGTVAACARACTGSVSHAIGVHIVGNMAAVPFGAMALAIQDWLTH